MATSLSVLKRLIDKPKAGRPNPAGLLERAKSKAQLHNENCFLRRQEIQQYAQELFKTIEEILKSAEREEGVRRNAEIRTLHLQMEEARISLDQSINRLEAFVARNL